MSKSFTVDTQIKHLWYHIDTRTTTPNNLKYQKKKFCCLLVVLFILIKVYNISLKDSFGMQRGLVIGSLRSLVELDFTSLCYST